MTIPPAFSAHTYEFATQNCIDTASCVCACVHVYVYVRSMRQIACTLGSSSVCYAHPMRTCSRVSGARYSMVPIMGGCHHDLKRDDPISTSLIVKDPSGPAASKMFSHLMSAIRFWGLKGCSDICFNNCMCGEDGPWACESTPESLHSLPPLPTLPSLSFTRTYVHTYTHLCVLFAWNACTRRRARAVVRCWPLLAARRASNVSSMGCLNGQKGEAGRSERSICYDNHHDISRSSQPRVPRGDKKVVRALGSFPKCVCVALSLTISTIRTQQIQEFTLPLRFMKDCRFSPYISIEMHKCPSCSKSRSRRRHPCVPPRCRRTEHKQKNTGLV
jgi:hypothetical protein